MHTCKFAVNPAYMSASFWLIDNDFLANIGTLLRMEKQYFILQAYEPKLERKVDTTITLSAAKSDTPFCRL